MSIASRIEAIEDHIKNDYNALERLGADLTSVNKNIENIASVVNDIYDKLPKVTGTGSDLSLTPTLKGGLNILPLGNAEQDSTTGKNMLNASAESYTISANTNKYQSIGNVDLVANIKYYISYNIDNASTSNLRSTPIIKLDVEGSTSYYQSLGENNNLTVGRKVWEFTPNASGTYKLEYWINKSDVAVTISQFMISTNSDITYEQYTGGIPSPNPSYPQDVKVVTGDNQVVVCNKNLVDWGTQSFTTYKDYQNLYIPVGTYTFSTKVTSSDTTYNYSRIYFYGNNYSTFISLERDVRKNATVTLTQNINRIVLYSSIDFQTSSGKTATYENIQLEKGSTATSYVVHQEQTYTLHLGSTELCKIGDYQDVITGTKDNWKIIRKVGKVILNGSESWEFFWATSGIFVNRNANIISRPNTINGLSNYFTATTRTNIRNNLLTVDNLIAFTQNELVIAYKLAQTIDDFKNWLSTHNTIAYYILKEQVEETITDTTLINELNELQELLSYDGTTNITITSDSSNAQMIAQVSALKGE